MSNNVNFAKDSMAALKAHTALMKTHYKAIGCHCECMGMMSENMFSAVAGMPPAFNQFAFRETMKRWGLINDKGEVIL